MSSLALSLLVSLSDQASAGLRTITGALGTAGKAVDLLAKNGEKFTTWGNNLRVARENVDDFTNRAKGALNAILAPAADVDNALATLTADAGPNLKNLAGTLEGTRAAALTWSSAHSQSAAQYIQTSTLMLQQGISEKDAIEATNVALRVSKGAHADAGGATKTLGLIYRQMGDQTKDAAGELGRLGDMLVRAKQLFPTIDVAALSDPLKDAIPAAKAAKVPVEQLIAVLGQFNAAGLQGGDGGAKFGAILSSLEGASKQLGFQVMKTSDGGVDLVGTLVGLEKQLGDVKNLTPEMTAKLQAAFGPESSKAVMLLMGQTGGLASSLDKIRDSAGTASSAQKALESSTSAQWQILNQQLDAAKLTMAQGITPALQSMMGPLKEVIGWFGGFAKEHPSLIAIVGTILVLGVAAGSVIGPLLSVGGAMFSLIGTLGSAIAGTGLYASITTMGLLPALGAATAEAWAFAAAMLANPITWIILAIVALAAVLYIYWEPISKFFIGVWDKVKVGFIAAWNAIKVVWGVVYGFISSIFYEIKGAFQVSFVQGVLTVLKYMSPLGWIMKAWSAVYPWLKSLWPMLVAGVKSGLTSILAEVTAGFDKGVIEGLKVVFHRFTPLGWLYTGWNAMTTWLFGLSLKDVALKILSTLWSGFVAGIGLIGDLNKAIGTAIGDAFSFFLPGLKNDLSGVGSILGAFNPLTWIKVPWSAVIGFVSGIWGEVKSSFDVGIVQGLATVFRRFTPLGWMLSGWNAMTTWLFGISLSDIGLRIVVSIGDGMRSGVGFVIGIIVGAKDQAIGLVVGMWSGITGSVSSGIESVTSALTAFSPAALITNGFEAARTWLANFSLADAGANIVNTIVTGMKSAAHAPAEAMQEVVQSVRNLLPFSPAKEGPLRDLHRVKLVETVAGAVNPAPLVTAMSGAAGAAMSAISAMPAPSLGVSIPTHGAGFAPLPSSAPSSGGSGSSERGGGGQPPILQLHVNAADTGGDAVAALEAWIANPTNAQRLVTAMQTAQSNEQRKGFAL